MSWLRSLAYNGWFFGTMTVLLLVYWVFLPFDRRRMQNAVGWWTRLVLAGLKPLVGIRYEIEGREHLPEGPVVIAAKHQSVWDTVIFYELLDDPQYVLKQELMRIPLWGPYARKCEMVAVDRKGGSSALRRMVADVNDRLARGRQVIIFPEGTRTAPGDTRPYHPGVYAIYRGLPDGVPLLPVAVNSGHFWGRRSFVKRPGTIRMRFLEPIPPGLDRKAFMALLQERIEGATQALAGPAAPPVESRESSSK